MRPSATALSARHRTLPPASSTWRGGMALSPGEGTFPLLRDNFVVELADTSNLNLPTPVRAAHVLGPVDREHPLGRLRAMARTPLADREAEMQALLDAWI